MIIVRLYGGMGNQMFQYAFGRALSIKYKTTLGLDLSALEDRTPRPNFHTFVFRDYSLDVYNIDAQIVSQKDVPFFFRRHFKGKIGGNINLYFDYFRHRFLKTRGVEKSFNFDPKALNVGPDAYVEGYWQSQSYFANIEDIIRRDLSLKKSLPVKSQQLFERISSSNSLCINVRRKEFVSNSFNGFTGREYYDKAMEYLAKHQHIEKIYVFSDDLEWCKQNFSFALPVEFVGDEYLGQKAEEYLYLMSACKHFIISNSTFAWWAAWLSKNKGKIVIAPKKWLADTSINTNDIFPESWIRM